MAKDVCAQLSQELVSVVPQVNDYLCPVCFAVAYRPVRLDCQHIFCMRCVINMQRHQDRYCPLCRADVVLNASAGEFFSIPQPISASWELIRSLDNVDQQLGNYMKKYFAEEVREKQRANDIERGIEDYGPSYTHKECVVM